MQQPRRVPILFRSLQVNLPEESKIKIIILHRKTLINDKLLQGKDLFWELMGKPWQGMQSNPILETFTQNFDGTLLHFLLYFKKGRKAKLGENLPNKYRIPEVFPNKFQC